ncbi:MAG: aldehyde ferredoxin oxidoreductase family protein [Deltaproteobacteria bacterium]|nr:aldehyde ferredoxin oxidoreductase family protein [Deltaproteobacteria bacterium]
MNGYAGKLLRVNLSDRKISKEEISESLKKDFLGGRGFAIKLLWDEVKHVDPLSEKNKIIFSTGPLSGQLLPSAGKMVIASKSPLTGGYGDGNIGTMASVHLRKAGYDAVVVEGKSEKPCTLLIEDENVKIVGSSELWGKDTFEAQDLLEKKYGKNSGILLIGPGGENLIPISTVMSQRGRAGGRPGMGAVMGSKHLKAIVIKGTGNISNFDDPKLRELGKKGYEEIKTKESLDFWMRQGTMQAFDWCNENGCLPTYNFKEGVFEFSKEMDGYILEKLHVDRKGCPMCSMQCGHVIKDSENQRAELDYENVGMLGPNIGLKSLPQVALLNRMADEWGMDTISLGSGIGFLMEASERGLIKEKIGWGDFETARKLLQEIGKGEGIGALVSKGVKAASEAIGKGSHRWAMHVKGLEISAYNCHGCPGMALSFGTSPIGAAHKDAWIIAWEISTDRFSYSKEKVQKLIEFQRIRGGFFESATVCRLPWVEVSFGLHWYPEYLEAITGNRMTWEDLYQIGDRIYNLIRAYWKREIPQFGRTWDRPPDRWFEEPHSQGKMKGVKIDREKYEEMLSYYYELRGWDENGIPLRETLDAFGLKGVAKEMMGS